MTVGREEDRLVGFVVVRLVDREGGVDVRPGELAARRDRVVGRSPPAGSPRREAAGREIRAQRKRVDAEAVAQTSKRDLHGPRGLERERSNVDVISEAVLSQKLEGQLHEALRIGRERDSEDPDGAPHALVVLAQPEHVELLLRRSPVRADAFEHAGAVLERVGREGHLRFRHGDEGAVEVCDAGLGDLLTDRRHFLEPLLDRARHRAPPTKKPPIREASRRWSSVRVSRARLRRELPQGAR